MRRRELPPTIITDGPDDLLVDKHEAAMLLGCSTQLLDGWRARGEGPEHVRLTPVLIRYRLGALREFIRRRSFSGVPEAVQRGERIVSGPGRGRRGPPGESRTAAAQEDEDRYAVLPKSALTNDSNDRRRQCARTEAE